jgi:hypothetical protein
LYKSALQAVFCKKQHRSLRITQKRLVLLEMPLPTLSTGQYNALYDFYNSTNGLYWTYWNITESESQWDFTEPSANPCFDHWQGLHCDCSSTSCTVDIVVLDYHNLTGTLPADLSKLPDIQILDLRRNNMTNSITAIGNLTKLQLLDLSINQFTGNIPSSFQQLKSLKHLILSRNRLTGPLPTFIDYSFPFLTHIDFGLNNFTGDFPVSFCYASNLTSLLLYSNNIISTIPSEIGLLTNLQDLDLAVNQFYGTIPIEISNMISLISLSLNDNLLSKTIPSTIFIPLTSLKAIYLFFNSFTGNVNFLEEESINIPTIYLSENFFNGTIQINTSSNTLIDLTYLNIYKNLFTGHLPWKESWKQLSIYEVQSNYFNSYLTFNTSSPFLKYFIAYDNYLTSSIPSNFLWNSNLLYIFYISNNLLTGSIPNDLFYINKTYMSQYLIATNYFSNSLPDDMGTLTSLVVLDVSNNRFSGNVPSSLLFLTSIHELFLQNNNFNGKLNSFLNNEAIITSSSSLLYTNIDLSNNEFSGPLPTYFFQNANMLQSFTASSNCFTGSLPLEICDSRSLLSLSLDGLTTADNCRDSLFFSVFDPNYFNAFTVRHFIEGNIPSCYYQLPQLQLLHLSGNGLSGSISLDFNISSSLTDLSLSHNILTGTIPTEIQTKSWINLDLSYNKLTGTLSTSFSPLPSNGSLSLQINRLSSDVPSSLIDTYDITILNGNIFSCDSLSSGSASTSLPHNDPDYSNYSCGSDSVNYIIYFWIIVIIVFPVALIVMYWKFSSSFKVSSDEKTCVHDNDLSSLNVPESKMEHEKIPNSNNKGSLSLIARINRLVNEAQSLRNALRCKSSNARNERRNVHLHRLSIYFEEVRYFLLYLTLYCLLILLPLYSILKVYDASYTKEYAWSVSAMLLSGEDAAVCVFLALLVFVVLIVVLFKRMMERINLQSPSDIDNTEPQSSSAHSVTSTLISPLHSSHSSNFFVYFIIAFFNLAVMSVVDFSYVYIVITYDFRDILLAAIGLALFRLVANNILLRLAIPSLRKWLKTVKEWFSKQPHDNQALLSSVHNVDNEYSVSDISFLENITLFNNIIIPGIAILFILPDCFYNALFSASPVTSSYHYNTCRQYYEPLSFSHDCNLVTDTVTYSPPFIYSYQCSSKIIINYVAVYLLMFIIVGIILPFLKLLAKVGYDRLKENEKERNSIPTSYVSFSRYTAHFLERYCLSSYYKPLYRSQQTQEKVSRIVPVLFSKLFVIIQINSYLTILIAFGALFPPLSVIACCAVYSITYFEELSVGYLLLKSRESEKDKGVEPVESGELGYLWYEDQLEKECKGIEESSNLTIWTTLIVSCLLYGYILFDTMGDTKGWKLALPMTLLISLLPFILLLFSFIHRTYVSSVLGNQVTSRTSPSVEVRVSEVQMVRNISTVELSTKSTEYSVPNPLLVWY